MDFASDLCLLFCEKVVDCRVCGDPNSILRFAFVEFTDEGISEYCRLHSHCCFSFIYCDAELVVMFLQKVQGLL